MVVNGLLPENRAKQLCCCVGLKLPQKHSLSSAGTENSVSEREVCVVSVRLSFLMKAIEVSSRSGMKSMM